MILRNTVQKDSSPAIEVQTVPQGGISFNQPSDTHLQGGKPFNRNPGEKAKVWAKTRQKNLVRNVKTGRYYARAWTGGREVWKSLSTSHFSVAQARLAAFLKEHRERGRNGGNGDTGAISAKMTFGEAAATQLRNLDNDVSKKPRTRAYWRERLRALEKSWLTLNETEVRRITQSDCKQWAGGYGKTASPTNYNNTVTLLRHMFGVAVEAGVTYSNPAAVLKRAKLRQKEIALPSTEKFNAMVAEMRNGHGRFSRDCANFVEGLASIRLPIPA